MRLLGPLVLLGMACATAAPAQMVQVLGTRTYYVRTTYITKQPTCAPDDGQTPAQWQRKARLAWQTAYEYASPEMYMCAALAARAGDPKAKILMGVMLTKAREMPFGSDARPLVFDPATGLAWFTAAADAGDGIGAFEAGQLYEFGVGTPQDDSRAIAMYHRAVDLGFGAGATRLKAVTNRAKRIADFESDTRPKAEGGDAKAMFAMYQAFAAGDPYAADDIQALVWLRRAAESGYGPAQSRLGKLSMDGAGGAVYDEAAGLDWLIKAAENGSHDNDIVLAAAYKQGSLPSATAARVADLAQRKLLRNWFNQTMSVAPGGDFAPDATEAATVPETVQQLTARAAKGEPDAQYLLGLRYKDGDEVPVDLIAAKSWFEKAATQVPDADMNLGDMAYTGGAGPVDRAAAAQAYAVAAVMGDRLGATNAYAIYRDKEGGAYDPVKAYAMALSVQISMPPPLEARQNDARLAGLQAIVTPQQRADALIWLCGLMLQHTPHDVEIKSPQTRKPSRQGANN